MSEAPQDGSKYVDQPDYQQLCAVKQRRIDELEGMLEQKHGWLRRGLVKVGNFLKYTAHVAIFPLRSPLRALTAPTRFLYKFFDKDPFFTVVAHSILIMILAMSCFTAWMSRENHIRAAALEKEIVEAAKQSEVGIEELTRYDDYRVGQLFPESKLITLTHQSKMEFVHVSDATFSYFQAWAGQDQDFGPLIREVRQGFKETKKWEECNRRAAEARRQPKLSQLSQMAEYDGNLLVGLFRDGNVLVFQKGEGGPTDFVVVSDEIFSCMEKFRLSRPVLFDVTLLKSKLEELRHAAALKREVERMRDEELEKIRNGECDEKSPEAK